MRKRLAVTIGANGRWPDAQGGFGVRFNWLLIDNRGSNSVDVSLSANPTAGDHKNTLFTVGSGKVRVKNVAGPLGQDGKPGEDWPEEVYLVSTAGSDVEIEVADHPIVDMSFAT